MVNRLLFGWNDLKEGVNVFVSISIIVSLYLSSNSDSIGLKELKEVVFDRTWKALLEVGFMLGAITDILTNGDAKLFDEG